VWFDQYGWVAFDPTPPATPARSQIGRLVSDGDDAAESDTGAGADGGATTGAGGTPSRQPGTRGEYYSQPAPSGDEEAAAEESGGGGVGLFWLPVALLALAGAGWLALRLRLLGKGLVRGRFAAVPEEALVLAGTAAGLVHGMRDG
jgi:hypothetical protein